MKAKSVHVLKEEVLSYFSPKERDLDVVKSTLVTLLEPMCALVRNEVYDVEVSKLERGVHYALSVEVNCLFGLTEEVEEELRASIPHLPRWELTMYSYGTAERNFLCVEMYRISTYKILI